jgi:hypothetical protein
VRGVLALLARRVSRSPRPCGCASARLREGLAEGRAARRATPGAPGFKLVVLELATAMVLLVGAGCSARACTACSTSTSGFEPDRSRPCRSRPRAHVRERRAAAGSGAGRQPVAACPASSPSAWWTCCRQLQRQHELDQVRRPAVQRRAQRGELARRQRRLLRDHPRDGAAGRSFTDATSPAPQRRHHQPDAGREVLPWRRSDRKRYGDTSLTPSR